MASEEKMRNFKNSIGRRKARNRFRRQCIRKRFQIREIGREEGGERVQIREEEGS